MTERELDILLYDEEISEAKTNLIDFTKSTYEDFVFTDFHIKYYTLLDAFAKGKIKRLMVTVPPQHGKSEGSSIRLPSFLLGHNPDLRIGLGSYTGSFASKFNTAIQRVIDTRKYHDMFPETTLSRSKHKISSENYARNSSEFEIVGKKGALKSVGRGGALTGEKIDVMIMDDLYKDYMEGNSPTIREAVWDWYTSVVNTRLHNDSQQIMVFTRWHEDDLIGRLEKKGKVKTIVDLADVDNIPLKHDEWFKINFEAIKTGAPTPIDPRKQGYSLWEDRHSYESLMASLELDKEKFNCLYQGNPQSQEGLMYGEFKTYFELPQMKIIKSYTDTADSGLDKLCSIVYGLPLNPADKYIYVLDVLYTDEPMEKTEPLTIQMLNRNNVNFSKVESNNGGKGFARVIQQGVTGTVTWFHQSGNKESRIFSNSASVVDRIIFPSNWYLQWGDFYNDVLNFKKLFKANKFDDCADALTGVIEEETKHTGEYDIR